MGFLFFCAKGVGEVLVISVTIQLATSPVNKASVLLKGP